MASEAPYITTCPVGCGDTLELTAIALADGRLRRCRECGQWVSAASEARYRDSMREFDVPEGTQPAEASQQRRFQQSERKLTQIVRRLNKSSPDVRLLDVGCSSGALVAAAQTLGFIAQGVEPAPRAASAAQAAGLNVRQGLLEEAAYPAESFDAVTLFEVVEHVREPLPLLKEAYRVLAPRGLVVIGTGNTASWTARAMGARWEYLDIARHGGHVSFFNPWSMTLLAQRAGFRIETIYTRNVRFANRGETAGSGYVWRKLLGELLGWPARVMNRGHDLLAFLRKD
jgi:2-polyprenyl-3-methyl-5-hydroxy-6-metoxy-1,4-benzoquinol methylase